MSHPSSVLLEEKDYKQYEKEDSNIYVVNTFIANSTFLEVKFIVDAKEELGYSDKEESYCEYVFDGCNVDDKSQCVWWDSAKKAVLSKVAQLRSAKNQMMKWEFWGEW